MQIQALFFSSTILNVKVKVSKNLEKVKIQICEDFRKNKKTWGKKVSCRYFILYSFFFFCEFFVRKSNLCHFKKCMLKYN